MSSKIAILLAWSIFCISIDKNQAASEVQFCFNEKLYSFTTDNCPGGVRFIENPLLAKDDCFCVDGSFLTAGEEFGRDYSVMATKKRECMVFSWNNVIKSSNSAFQCQSDSQNSRWYIVPITDVSSLKQDDSVAMWSDPSQIGNLEQFTRFAFKNYSHDAIFGRSKSQSFSNMVVVKGKASKLEQFQLADNCFSTNFPEGQIFIFDEMTKAETELGQNDFSDCNKDEDKKIEPAQVFSVGGLPDDQCELKSEDCKEHENTYAHIHKTPVLWSKFSDEEIGNFIKKENRELVEFRMRMEQQEARVLDKLSVHFEFLNMSQRILQAAAADVIPPKMIETAFKLFHYLYFDMGTAITVNHIQKKEIMYILEQCLKKTQALIFQKNGCPVSLRADEGGLDWDPDIDGHKKHTHKFHVPVNHAFNSEKHDAIVDMMWKAVDLTHAKCFPTFGFHVNLHPFFERQMEILFLMEPIQYRWNRVIPGGMNLYKTILPNLDLRTMENLDLIVGSVHYNDVFDDWLEKPLLDLQEARKKALGGNTEVNLNDYKIWGGLAYCMQINPLQEGSNKKVGLSPSLSQLSHVHNNGPVKCAKV